jgi:hypothetical protein
MKIKKTKGEILRLRDQLDSLRYESASFTFKYAISRNKALLDTVCRPTREQVPSDPKVDEYNQEMDKVNQKFSVKDESGAPKTVLKMLAGRPVPHYDIPDEQFKEGSEYKAETKALKDKYQADLDAFQGKVKEYETFLKTEEEFDVYGMNPECIPVDITQEHSDVIYPLLLSEPVPTV